MWSHVQYEMHSTVYRAERYGLYNVQHSMQKEDVECIEYTEQFIQRSSLQYRM